MAIFPIADLNTSYRSSANAQVVASEDDINIANDDSIWEDDKNVLVELREMEEAEIDAVEDAAGDPFPNMRKVRF